MISIKRPSDLTSDKLSNTELQVYNALQGPLKDGRGDVRKHARRARHEVRVQTGQRNFFAEGLQTAPRYLGVMEEIFAKHRLPVELTRLPLVESSFNKHAKSKVGAAGIWQFMENTGRKKKLIINDEIDERKSPSKATDAAAWLLKENHMILGRSWELAVTAWNHGPGGVKRLPRLLARAISLKLLSDIIRSALISRPRIFTLSSLQRFIQNAIQT
jgi:membrane-bound lytic murein transglycosylase D